LPSRLAPLRAGKLRYDPAVWRLAPRIKLAILDDAQGDSLPKRTLAGRSTWTVVHPAHRSTSACRQAIT